MVSHDVTFVRNIAEHIIAIDDTGVTRYPGGYDYYLEKLDQRGSGSVGLETGGSTSSQTMPEKPAAKGKDARKARAQQREAEKVLRKIENQVEKLTEEQAALNEEMMARRDADFATINAQLAKIQAEIQALESRWEAAAEALEG